MSEEYYVPTVKTQSQNRKDLDSEIDYQTLINKVSEYDQQQQQNDEQKSTKSPKFSKHSKQTRNSSQLFKENQSEQQYEASSRKTQKFSQQQSSNQMRNVLFESEKAESERPSTAQSSLSYSQKQAQMAFQGQGRQNLLDWDIKETTHVMRNPKNQYPRGKALQNNPDQREENHKYFQNTKINTCSKIVMDQGVHKAVPAYKNHQKTSYQKNPKLTNTMSVNQEQYIPKPKSKCGDRNKPLTPYNPNASRNRLPDEKQKIPYKNTSTIQLGSNDPDKKHYTSTKNNMQSYKNKAHFQTSNPGINAYRTTWYKKQEQK